MYIIDFSIKRQSNNGSTRRASGAPNVYKKNRNADMAEQQDPNAHTGRPPASLTDRRPSHERTKGEGIVRQNQKTPPQSRDFGNVHAVSAQGLNLAYILNIYICTIMSSGIFILVHIYIYIYECMCLPASRSCVHPETKKGQSQAVSL